MAIRKNTVLLPQVFQTPRNEKFLNATLDQITSPRRDKQLNNYIGRRNSPNFISGDSYVQEISTLRQNYQLEPAAIYRDASGTIKSVSTFIDTLTSLQYNEANVNNQDELWEQEYYNYTSFVDLDKLVNYADYYWIPAGPQSVDVFSGQVDTTDTYTVLREATAYREEKYDNVGYD